MTFNNGNEKDLYIILYNNKNYKEFIEPYQEFINFENFLDGNKYYYGLRNRNNLEIIPKEEKIIFDDELEIVALDFSVVAYKQLVSKYYSLLLNGQIASNSIINNMLNKPVRSQVGLNFQQFLDNNTEEFNKRVINNAELNLKTLNIKDYCETYSKEIKHLSVPIQTHIRFLNSVYTFFNVNGITFSLSNVSYGNDQYKVKFMSDLNFPVLRKLAEQYGFYVDENAPWQLVTNLEHPNIKKIVQSLYPNEKNIDTDFIIKNYYNTLLYVDYEKQKEFFYNSYKNLYNLRVEFSKPYFCPRSQTTILQTIQRNEPPKTLDDFLKIGEAFFLKTYLLILNAENNNKYDLVQINKILNQALKVYYKSLDKNAALLYIFGNFRKLVK